MKRGPAGRAARLQLALTLGLAALCAALALLALDARRAGKDIPAGAENASVPDSNAEAAAPVPTAPGNPEPGLRPLSVLACGDILLARTPGKRAAERGFRYLFEGVRGLVSSADLAFANLETPAAYTGAPYPGKPENVTFRADPATLFGLAWAGFDVLSLANNHMNDYGPRALAETLDYIDLLGMARVGAGRDLEEARAPAIMERDGRRIAFLAYAEPLWSVVEAKRADAYRAVTRAETRLQGFPPQAEAPRYPDRPGTGRAGVAIARLPDMVEDVRRTIERYRPDQLFVSVHWGEEHENLPRTFQRSFGRAAIDAGATAVLGHHPHILQPIERYRGGIIAYSLGNFVFDMAADHTYETVALRLWLEGGSLARAEIVPLIIPRYTYAPELAAGEDADRILNKLRDWTRQLGGDMAIEGSTGIIDFDS